MKMNVITSILLAAIAPTADAPAVDFARDVYPALQRTCVECHGPDKQEGGLRLDRKADALRGGDSGPAIVPGKPDMSDLVRRAALPRGDDEAMPPRGQPLSVEQISALKKWIAAGAVWPEQVAATKHWSYIKPVRPEIPKPRDLKLNWPAEQIQLWSRSPIDAFVAAQLAKAGIAPTPPAERSTLIRRLSLDLTGLPPSAAEVKAFEQDQSADAYEKLVDRLLASEEFGVRWARPWLDLARYADSHGFQRDDLRELWAYRDWVVRALNADMPFDQFTIEQVAGDLLPNATQDQRIATGFHRCTPTNVEAGTEPEESRINQVLDRVNTTGAVWLGSTLECAQCHNHKYDPFTQRDYYGLLAYFNNTEQEADRANARVPGSIRFLGPSMPLVDTAHEPERQKLRDELAAVEKEIADFGKQVAAVSKTERTAGQPAANVAANETTTTASSAAASNTRVEVLKIAAFDAESGADSETQADGSLLLSGATPDVDTYTLEVHIPRPGLTALKLEALAHSSLPGNGPGRGEAMRPNFVLNEFAAAVHVEGSSADRPLKFTQARSSFSQKTYPVAGAIDGNAKTAWAIAPAFHKSHAAIFELTAPLDVPDGATLKIRLEQNYGGGRVIGCLRLSAVYGPVTDSLLPDVDDDDQDTATPQRTRADKANKNNKAETAKPPRDPQLVALERRQSALKKQLATLDAGATLVMKELPTARMSSIFQRGDYKTPGDPVTAATPAVLTPAATGPANRLTLARWLVSPDNPLTPRVVVNRWWAELWGHGIVVTAEDFGLKGEPPTHPELLDYLAVELVSPADGSPSWSMKRVLRQMVLSAAYRQSSRVSPELLAKDDRNLLYARGPRVRLDAEAIRDSALSIAGLLSHSKGGPSIRPPQPDGLWRKVGGEQYDYQASEGEKRYRRGLYVVLKRGSPYPSFVNFDASSRMACVVRRSRSNTPLQALTLLNDPVYVDAALAFARRIMAEEPTADAAARVRFAFRTALARDPQPGEVQVLTGLYQSQLGRWQKQTAGARTLVGEKSKQLDNTAVEELAAWYSVAAAVLNLDETITKN